MSTDTRERHKALHSSLDVVRRPPSTWMLVRRAVRLLGRFARWVFAPKRGRR
jgi:hypothetical protein